MCQLKKPKLTNKSLDTNNLLIFEVASDIWLPINICWAARKPTPHLFKEGDHQLFLSFVRKVTANQNAKALHDTTNNSHQNHNVVSIFRSNDLRTTTVWVHPVKIIILGVVWRLHSYDLAFVWNSDPSLSTISQRQQRRAWDDRKPETLWMVTKIGTGPTTLCNKCSSAWTSQAWTWGHRKTKK